MNPEELARLTDAYRDGTISDEDARRLAAAIRAGGEASRRILRELEFQGLLARALEGDDAEEFARSFRERVSAEESESAFVRAFEGRRSLAAARKSAGWLLPLSLAAAALAAVTLALVLRPGPSEDGPGNVAERRPRPVSPTPPEPAAPPRDEPKPAPAPKPEAPPPTDLPRPAPAPKLAVPPEPKPEPAPEPEKKPEPASEEKVPIAPTRVAVATILTARGEVFRLDGGAKTPIADGQGLTAGQGLECVGAKSFVVAVFADGTRVELGPDTLVREVTERKGKRVAIAKGTLSAQVAKQPADAPMIFATPHGEARVLGTALRLEVDAHTRLEVAEGKVRLSRTGGKSADVAAGGFAVCGPSLDPLAHALHPEDIVLSPAQAKLVGDEWAIVPDRNASAGFALQVVKSPYKPTDHVTNRASYAIFTFHASADREYRLWVRSTSLPTSDKWLRDMVTVEPQNCAMSQHSPFFGAAPTNAFVFTGISTWSGYAWSSGSFDEAKPDREPIVLKFQRTGMQTLRVFTVHPSIRIDSVWLSARQLTRPAAKNLPPAESR